MIDPGLGGRVALVTGANQGIGAATALARTAGAAKAAQENYTMSAARELGPYGITANVVYPPATDTGWITPAVERAAIASSPCATSPSPTRSPRSSSCSPPTRPAPSPVRSFGCRSPAGW